MKIGSGETPAPPAPPTDLDLKWAAASEFIRDIFEALGKPQPFPEAIVDLPALALEVVGQIEELKMLASSRLEAPPTKCTCWIGRGGEWGSDRPSCPVHNDAALARNDAKARLEAGAPQQNSDPSTTEPLPPDGFTNRVGPSGGDSGLAVAELPEKWRGEAVVVDGNMTCVNHAYYRCAMDLKAALQALSAVGERPAAPPLIWQVWDGDWDGDWVVGTFATEDLAKAHAVSCHLDRVVSAEVLSALPRQDQETPK